MIFLDQYQNLKESPIFQTWQQQHPKDFLTHFYLQLDPEFKLVGNWEIGFADPSTDKITVFVVGEQITQKPEEEAFKKPDAKVEALGLERVKVDFAEALEIFKKIKAEKHAHQLLLNGFIILQTFQGKTMWNFSYATRSMNILNIKINTETKELISEQLINFMEQKAS